MHESVQAAWDALVQSYEDLIADPEGQIDGWGSYGTYDGCRLCDAVSRLPGADKNPYYKHSCQPHCPLGPRDFRELNKAKKWPSCVERKSYFDEMVQAIEDRNFDQIREVAPRRLAWLKKRVG